MVGAGAADGRPTWKLKRNVSYRGLMRMEAYKIQKHILDDTPYEPFISRW